MKHFIYLTYKYLYDIYVITDIHIRYIYAIQWSSHMTRSAAAHSTVLRAGWLSYGQCDFSTHHSSAPNEPIKMAFGTRDYIVEATPPANFYLPTPVSLPPGKG